MNLNNIKNFSMYRGSLLFTLIGKKGEEKLEYRIYSNKMNLVEYEIKKNGSVVGSSIVPPYEGGLFSVSHKVMANKVKKFIDDNKDFDFKVVTDKLYFDELDYKTIGL